MDRLISIKWPQTCGATAGPRQRQQAAKARRRVTCGRPGTDNTGGMRQRRTALYTLYYCTWNTANCIAPLPSPATAATHSYPRPPPTVAHNHRPQPPPTVTHGRRPQSPTAAAHRHPQTTAAAHSHPQPPPTVTHSHRPHSPTAAAHSRPQPPPCHPLPPPASPEKRRRLIGPISAAGRRGTPGAAASNAPRATKTPQKVAPRRPTLGN